MHACFSIVSTVAIFARMDAASAGTWSFLILSIHNVNCYKSRMWMCFSAYDHLSFGIMIIIIILVKKRNKKGFFIDISFQRQEFSLGALLHNFYWSVPNILFST